MQSFKFLRLSFNLARFVRADLGSKPLTTAHVCRRGFTTVETGFTKMTTFNSANHEIPNYRLSLALGGLIGSLWAWLGLEEVPEEDPLILAIKRGILAMQRQEYDKAEYILHLALKMAQDVMNDKAQTYIFAVMADNCFEKQNYEKAEGLYKTVMSRLLTSGVSQDDEAIIEMSLKLAKIYSDLNKSQLADEGFRFCLTSQENRIRQIDVNSDELKNGQKNSLALWGMIQDWYSQHLTKKGLMKDALKSLEEAHQISEKLDGPHGERTLRLLNDLGTLYNRMHNFKKAAEYFEKATQIGGLANVEDLDVYHYNLGVTYIHLMDGQQARLNCDKAFRISKANKNGVMMEKAKECIKKVDSLKKT